MKTKAERETIVRFSDDPDERLTVNTHKASLAKHLLAKGADLKREGRANGRVLSWTLECPRDWFRAPRPRRKGKPPSDAARKALQDRRKGLKVFLSSDVDSQTDQAGA